MTPAEIGRLLLKASRRDTTKFLSAYSKQYRSIDQTINAYSGLKSDLHIGESPDALDLVRFSAFANDLTTLSFDAGGEMKLLGPGQARDALDFLSGGGLEMSITTDAPEKFIDSNGELQGAPTFVMRSDDFAKRTVEKIAPLMMAGHTLIRPQRCILTPDKVDFTGRKHWKLWPVNPESPTDMWSAVHKEQADAPLPALQGTNNRTAKEVDLFNLSFPFLSGIGFYDLAKVLEDEKDHIAKARLALKKVVEQAKEKDMDLVTAANELLRPELDTLTRRFKSLSRSQSLKQGAAGLGVVVMSLVAYSSGGLLQLASGVAGAGGVGLLAKERATTIEKHSDLAEHPLYLMWRLKNIRRANA